MKTPYAWLRERDIDLLLCAELHHDGDLRQMFSMLCGADGMELVGAWISQTDGKGENRGESDLVVRWMGDDGAVIALIENKIAAQYQPNQGGRYAGRVEMAAMEDAVRSACSLLVAPASYLRKKGGEAFDAQISYEDITDALSNSTDGRTRFLAQTLRQAITQSTQRLPPHAATTAFWNVARRIAHDIAPGLNMEDEGDVSHNAAWHYFRQCDGMPIDRNGIEIVYKPTNGGIRAQMNGTVSLQVPRTCADVLRARLQDHLDADMQIIQAPISRAQREGKRFSSAMITIAVPFLRPADDVEIDEAAVARGIEACERLRRFSLAHMDKIRLSRRGGKNDCEAGE